MGKRCATGFLDGALNIIKTGVTGVGPANLQVILTAEPTTFVEANATFRLAGVAMAGADFTLANGDGAGTTPRKSTTAAKSAVSVATSGTATHVALLDTVNSLVLEVTTCTSQVLTSGNTVNIPAWTIEIGAPT